jgi:hypothetical protein
MSISPFGERSLTIVAARFDDRGSAERAASAVRGVLQDAGEVHVVGPRDPALAAKLAPEQRGIGRTLVRSLVVLGGAGGTLGMLIALCGLALSRHGFPDTATPLAALSAMLGIFLGAVVAGCLTLRPDQDFVIHQVREWIQRYKWAVVAHPVGSRSVQGTLVALHHMSARTIRSF